MRDKDGAAAVSRLGERLGQPPIPIFILQGQEDLTALPELAKAYFESIKAPRKQFYLVPGTGHDSSATELDMTLKVLVEQVRPLTLER